MKKILLLIFLLPITPLFAESGHLVYNDISGAQIIEIQVKPEETGHFLIKNVGSAEVSSLLV